MKQGRFKEKKLFFAFAFLILLILLIGLFGISSIQGLNRRIENLGKHSLKLERTVFEMRVNNTVYAMGIRNYVFWRSARYLSAAPITVNLDKILQAGDDFNRQLKVYQENVYLPRQKDLASQISVSFNELLSLGSKIISLVDSSQEGKVNEPVNNLLMDFENRVFKIDSFLNTFMGKPVLQEVEREVSLAYTDKQQAVFFLTASLSAALFIGILIAFAVYRRGVKERFYRQQLFNRLIDIEEKERKKLSSAVHDEMGQDLSAMKIYLGLIAQSLISGAEDAPAKIEECKKITVRLIEKSHNIASLLRPPDLDEVGLLESIESLLVESRHLTGIQYIFEKPEEKIVLEPEYSLLIYRLIQEFLTNMAKYARAKNVELRLNKTAGQIELFYRDDGRGFNCPIDAKKRLRRKEDKFGFGLLGLKERVEALDGRMRIKSACGKGTSILVFLPV